MMKNNQSKFAPAWLLEPTDVNHVETKIWPAGLERSAGGDLSIAGVALVQLAAQYLSLIHI
mgnify:CR=1 FL=1